MARAQAFGLALLLGSSSLASAANIAVTSTADTLTAGDGACTLREAIINANTDGDTTAGDCAAGSGADLIDVPADTYVLAIAGVNEDAAARGDLDINSDLTLRGAGATATVIDAAGLDRVLDIGPGAVASVERITLTGGITYGPPWPGYREYMGSAIRAVGDPAAWIYLNASETRIEGNQGQCWGAFAGLHCSGAVTGQSGILTLRKSAVTNNPGGGGIVWGGTNPAIIDNSTISGNTSTPVLWAGAECSLWLHWPAAIVANDLRLSNSTVANNTIPPDGPGGFCEPEPRVAIAQGQSGSLEARATILSNPGLLNCLDENPTVVVSGHSIDSDGSCELTDPTDLSNVDPLLGPLADNGGPTLTHEPLPGSPAIDAIPAPDCTYDDDGDPGTPEVPLAFDQRGLTRPEGSACDIGAVEVPEPAQVLLVLTSGLVLAAVRRKRCG